MRVAYLVNLYPTPSHSFIRRELRSIEDQGIPVERFTVRPPDRDLPDPADREEAARTRCLARAGLGAYLGAVLSLSLRRPRTVLRALAFTVRLGWRSHRGVLVHLAYLAEACVLERWLRAARVDHLHAHFATNPATVALLCRRLGGPPFSFTLHGIQESELGPLIGLPEKVEDAAFAVAISSFGRCQIWRWLRHELWGKVELVRCGLPRALLEAPIAPIPEAPRIVCVARLGEEKGHLLLVEAAARLAARGVAFELVLVGEGPMRPAIEALIRREKLDGRVRLTGSLSGQEVMTAIAASRAMVLPSFSEGLPVVLMEGLAAGRPVVASAISGIPELVQPGVNGWLFPAGSAEALAAALEEALATSPAQLAEMGRRGAALVRRQHDAEAEARRLAALFRRSAGAPAAPAVGDATAVRGSRTG